jgi:hypothetical protein
MSFSEDPTQGRRRGERPGEDPTGPSREGPDDDATQGREIGEEDPYEDSTQGREIGEEDPHEDSTSGREVGERPGEDPTSS